MCLAKSGNVSQGKDLLYHTKPFNIQTESYSGFEPMKISDGVESRSGPFLYFF